MNRLNNKGMTLVEMVVGVLLIAIAGTSLATCFASLSNTINRASLYKFSSMTASDSIEIGSEQTPVNDDYIMETFAYETTNSGNALHVIYKKNNVVSQLDVSGDYLISSAKSDVYDTHLTYREFVSSSSVDVPVS